MCQYSMIMDAKTDDWRRRYWSQTPQPLPNPLPPPQRLVPFPTQIELEEFRRLLERARAWDKEHNQPDCELEDKKTKLKAMAKELGVEISFV